jgi:hypothetical protein
VRLVDQAKEIAVTAHHFLMVEGVMAVFALLPHLDEIRLFQLFQMMAHRGLGDLPAQPFDDFVDRQPLAAQQIDDLQPGLIRKYFGKGDLWCIHISIISTFIYMSSGLSIAEWCFALSK